MVNNKTVGIIGGMGPDATVELMNQIIAYTPAEDDIDHIRTLVDNNSKIPSRRNAILFGTESPEPELIVMAQRLEAMGADYLVMPCNTAHYYYPAINNATSIDCWHLIELTVRAIKQQQPDIQSIGFLGTLMSKQLQLFEPYFQSEGIELIYPDDDAQEAVTQIILAVKKAGVNQLLINDYNDAIKQLNCKYLLLGCSELSVLHSPLRPNSVVISEQFITFDPIQLLAQAVIVAASK